MPSQQNKAPKIAHNPNLWYRAATLSRSAVDPESRTAGLTFSSEAAVNRWYGQEILLHDAAAVDLTRLNSMGACLRNHDPNQIVGPIVQASLGKDHRGHAAIGFDDDALGNECMAKAESGSLRGVSVGYIIHQMRRVQENEEWTHPRLGKITGPAYIATKWEPIEISLTPIPADSHVGVGRDATRSLDGIEIEDIHEERTEPTAPEVPPEPESETKMDKEMRSLLEEKGLPKDADDKAALEFLRGLTLKTEEKKEEPKKEEKRTEPKPVEATPISRSLAEAARAAGLGAEVLVMASEGKPETEIRDFLMAKLTEKRTAPVGPGGKAEDAGKFAEMDKKSAARAICAAQVYYND